MLYSYKECKKIYKTDYKIRLMLASGELKRIHRGFYSNEVSESYLEVIGLMYPYAVFTLGSAFFYHGLTDTIPKKYYLMTDKDAPRIKDENIKQIFDNNKSLSLGVEEKFYNTVNIKIFNKERMLIELIRNKNKLPFDYYKEVIGSYRNIIHKLDIQTLQEYAQKLPKTNQVLKTIELEIF